MKVLFLSWWFPYPPNNGSRIRIYNLLRQLSRRHTITLFTFSDDPVADEVHLPALQQICAEVRVAPRIPFAPGRWQAVRGFLSSWPRFFVESHSPEMTDLVAQEAQAHDVVIASQVWMSRYALAAGDRPKVLEELETTTFFDGRNAEKGAFWRLRYWPMWWKFRNMVRQLARRFDAITVASAQEARLLGQITSYPNRVAVVPNAVDLTLYKGDCDPPQPNTLIFPGALTFYANYGAMNFFLKEIFPKIKARRPEVVLRITGHTKGVDLEGLPLGDGVILTGYLDDVRPAVAQSWATVVPLLVGGGTRLKILESMALGTPVISTAKGAEGLDVTPGRDILIANDPEAFAQAVLRLLSDADLRARLADGGRRLVEKRYTWPICARRLDGLLGEVVGEGKGSL